MHVHAVARWRVVWILEHRSMTEQTLSFLDQVWLGANKHTTDHGSNMHCSSQSSDVVRHHAQRVDALDISSDKCVLITGTGPVYDRVP